MAPRTPVTDIIGRGLAWWVEQLCRRPLIVVVLTVATVGYLLVYAGGHIGMNTDTADMISRELPWRQDQIEYKRAFPESSGEIVIVIDAQNPDMADKAERLLARALKKDEKKLFKSVYAPLGEAFFERNGLLYLDTEELENLADNLSAIQPFMGRLVQDQTLTGVLSMLEDAMQEKADGTAEVELAPVFEKLNAAFRARVEGRFHRLSWQELILGRDSTPDERRRIIMVRPRLDFTEFFPGEAAVKEIRRLAAGLELDEAHGVRVRMTGSVYLGYEELKSVMRGAEAAGAVSVILVTILLLLALRSPWLVFASLITLFAGLTATAAFATAAVGRLNLISMAFAVLYIGLGIDYAIHFCLRYRELVTEGLEHARAIRNVAGNVGSSLLLCAVTTSAGFYAFIPTSYSGVSELGLISGTGMFISLFLSLTLLPALLSLRPMRAPKGANDPARTGILKKLSMLPARRRRAVWAVAALCAALSVALLPWVRFESDPMELRDQQTESVSTYNELMEQSEHPPLYIAVVKPNLRETESTAERLKRLDTVDKTVTIKDFIPKEQDEKLAIIEEIALLLGPELDLPEKAKKAGLEERLRSLETFQENLRGFAASAIGKERESARGLLEEAGRFNSALDKDKPGDKEKELKELEQSLVAFLPDRLGELRTSLEAAPVDFASLPEDLRERWVSRDGKKYLVQVYPQDSTASNAEIERFVREVTSIEPHATGTPVIVLKAGDAVVYAFERAFLLAFIFVCILLYALLRSISDTVLVLVPLLLAGLLTGAATVAFAIPFNFANIIALPLLLGIGVDNGIHMVHRYRAVSGENNVLLTSTTRAVFFSTFTTIASFGTLAFSSHPGVASMGKLLAVGVVLTLLCTVVALPSFLSVKKENKERSGG